MHDEYSMSLHKRQEAIKFRQRTNHSNQAEESFTGNTLTDNSIEDNDTDICDNINNISVVGSTNNSLQSQHTNTTLKSFKSTLFTCNHCSKKFSFANDLRIHTNQVHTNTNKHDANTFQPSLKISN